MNALDQTGPFEPVDPNSYMEPGVRTYYEATVERRAEDIIKKINSRAPDLEEQMTAEAILRERAVRAARNIVDAEESPHGYAALEVAPLAELLTQPDKPIEWRIQGLMQIGHNVTMAARYKVGKTTKTTNLIKSLVDRSPYLGSFATRAVTGNVVVFNHELSDTQFTAWLRKARIRNTDRVIPVNLRGKGLYLQDEAAQEWAIELLRKYNAEVWIIDPLQAALRGTVNDDTVASEWIAAADRVKAEAGVSEMFLVTHTGHLSKADEAGRSTNERSAGSARWSGWPDALWIYTMDAEGTRYLSAEGRDIALEEIGLDFDPQTLELTSKGHDSGRASRIHSKPYRALYAAFEKEPDAHLTRKQIEGRLKMNNTQVTHAIEDAINALIVEQCGDECDHRTSSKGPKPNAYRLTDEGMWTILSTSLTSYTSDNLGLTSDVPG